MAFYGSWIGRIPAMFRAVFGNKKGGGGRQDGKHKKHGGKRNEICICKESGTSAW